MPCDRLSVAAVGGARDARPGRGCVVSSRPSLMLVVHGTRDPAGAAVTERVTAQVAWRLPGVAVAACYVDVAEPTPAAVLSGLPGTCVVVPMFLASGYHVRVDLPAQLRATARSDLMLTDALGPDPSLVTAAAQRLAAAGIRDGDALVLAVAGSSQPDAHAETAKAARDLSRMLGRQVIRATIAAGGPRIETVVAALRDGGAGRVAVASWLLAPGQFQRRLQTCGADVIADPIGDHSAVAELVRTRYQHALTRQVRTA